MTDKIHLEILEYKNGYINGIAHMLSKFCGNKHMSAACCSLYNLDEFLINKLEGKDYNKILVDRDISEILWEIFSIETCKASDEDILQQIHIFLRLLEDEYGEIKNLFILNTSNNLKDDILLIEFSEFAVLFVIY